MLLSLLLANTKDNLSLSPTVFDVPHGHKQPSRHSFCHTDGCRSFGCPCHLPVIVAGGMAEDNRTFLSSINVLDTSRVAGGLEARVKIQDQRQWDGQGSPPGAVEKESDIHYQQHCSD